MSVLGLALLLVYVVITSYQAIVRKIYSKLTKAPAPSAACFYCGISGLMVALGTYVLNGFVFTFDLWTVILGIVGGIMLFFINFSAIEVANRGPYAFQAMMLSFSGILIPLLFSFTVWGDTVSTANIIGIVMMLVSVYVFNCSGNDFSSVKKGYFLWCFFFFASNGFYNETLDIQKRLCGGAFTKELVLVAYAFCALLGIIYLLTVGRSTLKITFAAPKRAYGCIIQYGLIALITANLLVYILKLAPATIVYPAKTGGILVSSAILAVLLLKEKLATHQKIAVAIAVAGIVVINL